MTSQARHPRSIACLALAAASMLLAVAPALAGGVLAFGDPRLQSQTPLQVSLAGVAAGGGPLPRNYARDGRNISPAVGWTDGPPATRGYVLIVQDADAPGPDAYVHWLAYDVPPQVTALARGLHNLATLTRPLGVEQGRNSHGGLGYTGPDVALGEAAHRYHFQVFALDRRLRTAPGADIATLERDMADHVIARGELVATYTPPPPSRAPGDKTATPAPAAPAAAPQTTPTATPTSAPAT